MEVVPPDLATAGFVAANWGLRPVCIVAVKTPPGLNAELHVTQLNGTVAAMVKVDKVCIQPFSSVRFGSLTYHIMLMGNVSVIGDGIKMGIVLDDGRTIEIYAPRSTGGHVHLP